MNPSSDDTSLSGAQLDVMNIIWDSQEATVREVWKELCKEREVARNTVLTTITRLYDKGWLTRRTRGNAHLYRAARPRQKTLGRMVGNLVATAFQGSTEGLLRTLFANQRLSAEELERIRQMIDEAKPTKRGRSP